MTSDIIRLVFEMYGPPKDDQRKLSSLLLCLSLYCNSMDLDVFTTITGRLL